jgi:hypothetical protein
VFERLFRRKKQPSHSRLLAEQQREAERARRRAETETAKERQRAEGVLTKPIYPLPPP